MLIIPFIRQFCFIFSLIDVFITHFSPPMRAIVLKFGIRLQKDKVYCVKKNLDAKTYLAFFFPSFPSFTPMQCIWKFVSKIAQEHLHLAF